MKNSIKSFLFFIVIFSVFYFIFSGTGTVFAQTTSPVQSSTLSSNGGLVPCGFNGGHSCNTICYFFALGQNVFNFIILIAVALAAIAFVVGGFLWVLSGFYKNLYDQGKDIVLSALWGIVIIFAAWLIVNTIINFFGNPAVFTAPWNQLQCQIPPDDQIAGGGSGGGGTVGTPGPSVTGGGGGGTCQAVASGPCSVSALSSSCFDSKASQASQICNMESGGVANKLSTVDKCGSDPVSIGLFQINISANSVASLDCPSAFNHPFSLNNPNCTVTNRTRYNECVAAAENIDNNIQTACRLSSNGTNWRSWTTASSCGL